VWKKGKLSRRSETSEGEGRKQKNMSIKGLPNRERTRMGLGKNSSISGGGFCSEIEKGNKKKGWRQMSIP